MLTVDTDRLGVASGDVVLDLGCGAGRHSYRLQRVGTFPVAVDLDDASVKDAFGMMGVVAHDEGVDRGGAAVGNALTLPFGDGVFDRVIASEILEHIPEDLTALDEIARVLKPGGTVAITVPRMWPEGICWALSWEYHDTPGGHVRIYRRGQLISRAISAGLIPYDSHHAHAFHAPFWWLRCALDLSGDAAPVRWYHRALVWDIEHPNRVVRTAERALDPFLGKSVALYFRKPDVG
ncbi:MAG: class I SAM-dependent methyltransferase [Actinomycetota bacterium]